MQGQGRAAGCPFLGDCVRNDNALGIQLACVAVTLHQTGPTSTSTRAFRSTALRAICTNPFLRGMLSDSGECDAASFQVQEEHNVISCQPVPREHLGGEEIETSQDGHVS